MKVIFTCAKCAPTKGFHEWHGKKPGTCEICKRRKTIGAIPKRFFSKTKLQTIATTK